MKKVLTGDLKSEFTQLPVGEEMKGLPRTLSLAVGAALLWMFVAIWALQRGQGGQVRRPSCAIIALVGISMPVFWIGALMNYYLGFKLGWFWRCGSSRRTQSTGSTT